MLIYILLLIVLLFAIGFVMAYLTVTEGAKK